MMFTPCQCYSDQQYHLQEHSSTEPSTVSSLCPFDRSVSGSSPPFFSKSMTPSSTAPSPFPLPTAPFTLPVAPFLPPGFGPAMGLPPMQPAQPTFPTGPFTLPVAPFLPPGFGPAMGQPPGMAPMTAAPPGPAPFAPPSPIPSPIPSTAPVYALPPQVMTQYNSLQAQISQKQQEISAKQIAQQINLNKGGDIGERQRLYQEEMALRNELNNLINQQQTLIAPYKQMRFY